MPEQPSDERAMQLVRWVLAQAHEGIGPLSSASDLADEYRRGDYPSPCARVDALIRWEATKNAGTGFVTGLGGLITLPVAIPSALAASTAIQCRMVAAVAELYGFVSKAEPVQTATLLCLIGNAGADVVKSLGIRIVNQMALSALTAVPGKILIEINKKVGFRLLTKFGERGVVNLVKVVPLVGGFAGAAFDGTGCYAVGRIAKRMFGNASDCCAG